MDVRHIAWAGYVFEWTAQAGNTGPPEFESEEIGEMVIKSRDMTTKAHIKGKGIKPKMVAFPGPTL